MKAKPYVGITGPVSVEETKSVCEEFLKANYSMAGEHIPMLGFLVSYKTLNNQPIQNRRYPSIHSLPDLLKETNGQVLTMIHYNSKEISTLSEQVEKIFKGVYDEGLCSSIQLNIPWPDVHQVAKIKEKHPGMQLVFQASNKVLVGKSPNQIAKGIKNYGDLLSYVLIDPSGGRGVPFDLDASISIYSEIRERSPYLTVGFAGGFQGDNVKVRLNELINRINETEFCIDAEGGLRDKITSQYGDDLLNLKKVNKYLQSASLILK
jgi:hypothetical protein